MRITIIFIVFALFMEVLCGCNIPVKPTVSELCSKGNYESAYKIANDEEKLLVEAENITAFLSRLVVDSMIAPGSFILRNAYVVYGEEKVLGSAESAVQYISGIDRYGTADSFYVLWNYNTKLNEWECEDIVTGYISTDNENKTLEEAQQNLKHIRAKYKVESIIKYSSNLLPLTSVKNINNLFENDLLWKVELLPIERVHVDATETLSPAEMIEAAVETAEAMRFLTQTAEAPHTVAQTPVP